MTITPTETTNNSTGRKNGHDSSTPEATEPITPLSQFSEGVYTLDQFAALKIEPLKWLVQDTIPAGALGMILAAEKAGKSLFQFDVGEAVARGNPFFGFETIATNVLIIEQEGPAAAWQKRIHKMFGNNPPKNLFFRHRMITDLTNLNDLAGLAAFIKEHHIGLVFIGPLAQVGNVSEENKPDEINSIAKAMNMIIKETGATIFIIHHRRKPQNERDNFTINGFFHTSRGTNALAAAVDVAIGLQREVDEPEGKMFVMLRDGPGRIDHYRLDFSTLRISPTERPLTTKSEKAMAAIQNYLFDHGRPASRQEIEAVINLSTSQTHKYLTTLIELNRVEKIGEGASTGYGLTEEVREAMQVKAAEQAARARPEDTF